MPRSLGRPEAATCSEYVVPKLRSAGWASDQVAEQYAVKAKHVVAPGGVIRKLPDSVVDYVLEAFPGVPTAVVEAKRENASPAKGLQKAIRYAQQLDVPIAYSTNGHGIVERNLLTGEERELESFRTPAELWALWLEHRGIDEQGGQLIAQPFNRNKRDPLDGSVRVPRWYQTVAVHRVLRNVAQGKRRALLLMATGTGKTLVAMQLVAKLRAHHRVKNLERNFRVLYLADRDALLTQPKDDDFVPAFGEEPLHRVRGGFNDSREIYFASYQALTGEGDVESLFHDYDRDFFDLVIVDECHRGSASTESSWRRVLDHFSPAVQVGLTATPRRDGSVDTYSYFGNPVFEYTLRQGIEEGYLAPYRVRRVVLSPDADGWMPSPQERDRLGREIPYDVYETAEFERVISLLARTRLAAHHLSGIVRREATTPRTVIFCVDQQHAEDMRAALVRENPDLMRQDSEAVVRIVAGEDERVRLLDDFRNPDSPSPAIATTSRLLATGVDIPDLRYVVLFRPVGSMVEFKQIIGRGTRIYPAKNKHSFEIVDYVGATRHFNDPEFDGYPTHITTENVDDDGEVVAVEDESGPGEASPIDEVGEPAPPFDPVNPPTDDSTPQAPRKYFVDHGTFHVALEAIQVPDRSTGQLRLTSLGQRVRDVVREIAPSAGDFAGRWAHAPTREQIRDVLAEEGIGLDELVAEGGLADCDPLDVLLQVGYNLKPRTRAARAAATRAAHGQEIAALPAGARNAIEVLIDRYASYGVDDITSYDVLNTEPLRQLGSPVQITREFGSPDGWREHLALLQQWLYTA